MAALAALDRVFRFPGGPDPYYEARRRDLVLVAFNCWESGETCFCASMGTGPGLARAWDLAATRLEEGVFLLEVGSRTGGRLVVGLRALRPAAGDFRRKEEVLAGAAAEQKGGLAAAGLPEAVREAADHLYFEEVASKCFACANCTSVCPTCYCADIFDETDLALRRVLRKRRWCWCFLEEFATVHSGNYRAARSERLRQFVLHKLSFSVAQYGLFHCVGCGRCLVWCPANIDISQAGRVVAGGK